jgi:hypothetical protein
VASCLYALRVSIVIAFVASAILNGVVTLVDVLQGEAYRGVQGAVQNAPESPSIAGAWTLNKDRTDDPAKVLAGVQSERSRGGDGGGARMPGGFGGGMGGRRGGTGEDRSRMDPEKMQEMRDLMRNAIEPPARLTITQVEGTITFTDGDGRSQTYATTNKKEKHPFENRTVETKTKWDHGRLIRETSLGDGMKLTETYTLAPETRELHVLVKLESQHGPLTLRRVYDDASIR